MTHLSIDTSSSDELVLKIRSDNNMLVEEKSPAHQNHAQRLLPTIVKLLESENLTFADLASIEVNTGPGSYTGLRVGVSVSQALGYALGISVNGKTLPKEKIEVLYQ
ncbi:MAG: tRNA (adenosine(37)-N6)-threonylcarbamoyltransferase complex dimerization subunit type 1 TsaB [bacterium]|nr:tRNA (adenosine(37)-N6)-threonylcarbamoyltransferase complex dimerization subunit type 1 TsaB [bacterium]